MGITTKTMAIFWCANMRHKWLFMGSASAWLLGMVLQKLVLALIAAQATNKLVAMYNTGQTDYWPVFWPYLATFAVVGLAATAFIELSFVWLSKIETKAYAELQERAFGWLQSQSLGFHADTFSGALVSKVNKFTSAYVSLTDIFILQILRMATNVIIATCIVAFFSPLIAGVMVAWTLLFGWLNIALTRRRIPLSKATAVAESTLTAHLADALGNISAIKAFAGERTEAKLHHIKSIDRSHKKYVSWMQAIKNDAVFGTMMVVLQFGVLALSIYAVLHHAIDLGTLLLIQVYIAQLITELWGLSSMSRNIERALADGAEMTELLEQQPAIADPLKPEKARMNQGEIAFHDVTFTHDERQEPLFEQFELRIQPGEKVGLVGHSGSGKTTLTRLLLRFSDIQAGTITIDGQDIRSIRQADLRGAIAYVPQEPHLFHRSLHENISYGNPGANKEQVQAAATRAHAAEFIDALPRGYETMVGERGVKLSGGQRQRIAIARAILKDAPILVLDEATSALDSESEKLIQAGLVELMRHRTAIVIAHRLSTVQKMDRIIVLDNGRIAEQGSHASLLRLKGIYHDLWTHQSGGFLEET